MTWPTATAVVATAFMVFTALGAYLNYRWMKRQTDHLMDCK
jgi:hypothetical protein